MNGARNMISLDSFVMIHGNVHDQKIYEVSEEYENSMEY